MVEVSKKCTKCLILKDVSEFRIRKDKYKNKVYKYLESTCRECERKTRAQHHEKKKHDPEYKLKNRIRGSNYHKDNFSTIKVKQKKWREKPETKVRRKQYDQENKARIAELSKKRHDKWIQGLSPAYIIYRLKQAGIPITKQAIAKKKKEITIRRLQLLIKKLENEK